MAKAKKEGPRRECPEERAGSADPYHPGRAGLCPTPRLKVQRLRCAQRNALARLTHTTQGGRSFARLRD
ncbi:hypothetical protein [Acutalibacter intestini]|uniref:hypothetical protein n=1 Tax=Acutalibacter intestini TaxID=3093659 RepID=UPI002AC8F5D3|nr:hypothetical protein [Acutalibacter sp. M00204]